MISASHNPYYDNGIKFFNAKGEKLSKDVEESIEELVGANSFPSHEDCGKSMRLDDAAGRYVEFAKASFTKGQNLSDLKIVLDCAHGAAYKVAPRVFWELGAHVIPLSCEPNGRNINENCGALHPEALFSAMKESNADVGISLDGDADRLVLMTPKGQIVNGDQLLALLAYDRKKSKTLKGGIVSSCMSNLGFKEFLNKEGIQRFESSVGDKNVLKIMKEKKCDIGGEECGHIILSELNTTGDGIIAALQLLDILVRRQAKMDEIFPIFTPYPQVIKNFPCPKDFSEAHLKPIQKKALTFLGPHSEVVIRKSGTENLIRVMIQNQDDSRFAALFDEIIQPGLARLEKEGPQIVDMEQSRPSMIRTRKQAS
jgi:phosphoglucosamine mutase